jgi:hypothetical protein
MEEFEWEMEKRKVEFKLSKLKKVEEKRMKVADRCVRVETRVEEQEALWSMKLCTKASENCTLQLKLTSIC